MPKRRVPHGTASYVGALTLERAGGRIIFRSLLERDALSLLEFDPAVLSITRNDLSDAERIAYEMAELPDNLELRAGEGVYTPDLRITTDEGLIFIEVGPLVDKGRPDHREKLEAARADALLKGVTLVVMTEREVRLGERLKNVLRLRSCMHYRAPEALLTRARELLTTCAGRLSVADATRTLSQDGFGATVEQVEATLWYVVARAAHAGRLVFPLDTEELTVGAPLALLDD